MSTGVKSVLQTALRVRVAQEKKYFLSDPKLTVTNKLFVTKSTDYIFYQPRECYARNLSCLINASNFPRGSDLNEYSIDFDSKTGIITLARLVENLTEDDRFVSRGADQVNWWLRTNSSTIPLLVASRQTIDKLGDKINGKFKVDERKSFIGGN